MLERVWREGNPTLLVGMQLVQPLWTAIGRSLKKLKIELPYHPAIPLLGIYIYLKVKVKDLVSTV